MIADMATSIDAARLLVMRAAYLEEKGLPFSIEASMAKLFASDIAMKATATQYRSMWAWVYERFTLERFYRDVKLTR